MKRIPTGYSLHECPPAKETALLSIQQIIVAVFNVIPVPLLIGAGIGLSASEITLLVAGCLLVTGLATILQCLGAGPAGARLHLFLFKMLSASRRFFLSYHRVRRNTAVHAICSGCPFG